MPQLTPSQLLTEIANIWVSGISVPEAQANLLQLADALDLRAKNDEGYIYISPTQRISVSDNTSKDILTIERYDATNAVWEKGDLEVGYDSINVGSTGIIQYGDCLGLISPDGTKSRIPRVVLDNDGIGTQISVNAGSTRDTNAVIQGTFSDELATSANIFWSVGITKSIINSLILKSGSTVPSETVEIRVYKGHKSQVTIDASPWDGLVFDGFVPAGDFGVGNTVTVPVGQRIEFEAGENYTVVTTTTGTAFSFLGNSSAVDPFNGGTQFAPYIEVDRTVQTELLFPPTPLNITDVVGGVNVNGKVEAEAVELDTATPKTYLAGQISYDPTSKTGLMDTGYNGVRVNLGQEHHFRTYNGTGGQVNNGVVVTVENTVTADEMDVKIYDYADALECGFVGLLTLDTPDATSGLVTTFGEVRDIDTSSFTVGKIYAGANGTLTQTRPTEPNNIIVIGRVVKVHATEGIIWVNISRAQRPVLDRSYSFTSQGIAAGTYYKAGFYDWATADANLTQASATVTYGTAGRCYGAHASIVPAGAGTVNTGQVGLRVTGTKDNTNGTQTISFVEDITDDITTLVANTYYETPSSFSGQVTFELYVVSGSPTTYSLDFNYGYSKYEDFADRDATLTTAEFVWLGGASDTSADLGVFHHKSTGWTYAATGFVPGNGYICRMSVDRANDGNIANGIEGAYKRVQLDQFIQGSGSEGLLVEIITGANNTFQSLDIHLGGVSED